VARPAWRSEHSLKKRRVTGARSHARTAKAGGAGGHDRRRFAVKYLLGVMNSSAARDFLRANRRSNITLYPRLEKLPIPDVPLAQQQTDIALVDQISPCGEEIRMQISAPGNRTDAKINSLYGITTTIPLQAPSKGSLTLTGTLSMKVRRTEAGMKDLLRDRSFPNYPPKRLTSASRPCVQSLKPRAVRSNRPHSTVICTS